MLSTPRERQSPFMITRLSTSLRRCTRAAALALFFLPLSACEKRTEKSEAVGAPEKRPPLSPEELKSSFAKLKSDTERQADSFRALRARVNGLPPDLLGLSSFKEGIGRIESSFGALRGRVTWLEEELALTLREKSDERLRSLEAQVASIASDLVHTGHALGELEQELPRFDEYVARQTSWIYQLPGGYEMRAAPGGLERNLIDFVTDGERSFDPHAWFRFDRLYFIDLQTELVRPRSEAQLENVAAILKAYPKLELELTAFDRDQQRREELRQLVTNRLGALKSELEQRGIAPSRLRILNFGPDCPAQAPERCPNSLAARPRTDAL